MFRFESIAPVIQECIRIVRGEYGEFLKKEDWIKSPENIASIVIYINNNGLLSALIENKRLYLNDTLRVLRERIEEIELRFRQAEEILRGCDLIAEDMDVGFLERFTNADELRDRLIRINSTTLRPRVALVGGVGVVVDTVFAGFESVFNVLPVVDGAGVAMFGLVVVAGLLYLNERQRLIAIDNLIDRVVTQVGSRDFKEIRCELNTLRAMRKIFEKIFASELDFDSGTVATAFAAGSSAFSRPIERRRGIVTLADYLPDLG